MLARARRPAGFALALALLAGCASTELSYSTRIAGGERLSFQFIDGRVMPAHADGLEVLPPQIGPDIPGKRVRYVFGIDVKKDASAMKSVRIDDVSDQSPVLLVEDSAPAPRNGRWVGFSAFYDANAPETHWISYLDDSFRVYRLTVTRADGRTTVLYEGHMFPAFAKAMMRHMLGSTP